MKTVACSLTTSIQMQVDQEDWISGALRQGTSCEIKLVRSRIKHATVAATVVFCMYRSSRES